jgi:DNA-binding transcriptional ArsR family regulator
MSLAEELGIAPATASEHLKVLRKTGLVDLTASGTSGFITPTRTGSRSSSPPSTATCTTTN